jgi:hypothetical protein
MAFEPNKHPMDHDAGTCDIDESLVSLELPLHPPLSAILPLHQLEGYLATLPDHEGHDDDTENDNTLNASHQQQPYRQHQNHHHQYHRRRNPREQRETEILQVADFLYGNMLASALKLLDDAPSWITKITAATSQRSLFLVKSSTSAYNRFRGAVLRTNNANGTPSSLSSAQQQQQQPQQQQQQPSSYLCLVPSPQRGMPTRDPTCPTKDLPVSSLSNSIYYCSCRAFYENTRHAHNAMTGFVSAKGGGGGGGTAVVSPPRATDDNISPIGTTCGTSLCKHLLAVLLLPHLHVPTSELTVLSEADFANLILERISR